MTSTSEHGLTYDLVAAGPDVGCSCPAFEYRGSCRHTREVRAALAAGRAAPAGYQEVP